MGCYHFSVQAAHRWSQGQGTQRRWTYLHALEDPACHHSQVSLRRGYQDLGSLPCMFFHLLFYLGKKGVHSIYPYVVWLALNLFTFSFFSAEDPQASDLPAVSVWAAQADYLHLYWAWSWRWGHHCRQISLPDCFALGVISKGIVIDKEFVIVRVVCCSPCRSFTQISEENSLCSIFMFPALICLAMFLCSTMEDDCPICALAMILPTPLIECGHRFCFMCIKG